MSEPLFINSYKPLREVKIVSRETTLPSFRGPSNIVIWEAFSFAICDGVRKLDTRISIMFDVSEQKLRERCAKFGYKIVKE